MAFAPFIIKDVSLTIDGGTPAEYKCEVSQVSLTPTVPIVEAFAACPDGNYKDVGVISWSATITYFQDWTEPASLANYLFENIGTTKHMTFEPQAGGTSFEADVVVVPGAVGGTVNEYATADAEMPVSGQVTKTAPAVAAV